MKVANASPEALARAKREAEVARILQHPNVMPAVELHPDGEWLLFPLADGTLGQYHGWKQLTDTAALDIANAVGRALVHAHEHESKVLHRDLHPENILRHDGAWRVADWGLSFGRSDKRLTRTRSVGGMLTWTAPEQLVSLKSADERADVFSLGRIVGWLASGVIPDPGRPSDLPSGHPLRSFVTATTALDRAHRPATIDGALQLLPERQMKEEPVTTPRLDVGPATIQRIQVTNSSPLTVPREAALRQRHEGRTREFADSDAKAIVSLFPTSDHALQVDLLPLKQSGVSPMPPRELPALEAGLQS